MRASPRERSELRQIMVSAVNCGCQNSRGRRDPMVRYSIERKIDLFVGTGAQLFPER